LAVIWNYITMHRHMNMNICILLAVIWNYITMHRHMNMKEEEYRMSI